MVFIQLYFTLLDPFHFSGLSQYFLNAMSAIHHSFPSFSLVTSANFNELPLRSACTLWITMLHKTELAEICLFPAKVEIFKHFISIPVKGHSQKANKSNVNNNISLIYKWKSLWELDDITLSFYI